MKRKIDLTLPFVAIRKDVPGGPYTPTMGEYLCNPLEEDLLDVEISTGGWYSADDLGVIDSIPQEAKPAYTIPAGECVRFALSTEDEYNEMAVHWTLRYRTVSAGVRTESFGSFKRLKDARSFEKVPILGSAGRVVPRSLPD